MAVDGRGKADRGGTARRLMPPSVLKEVTKPGPRARLRVSWCWMVLAGMLLAASLQPVGAAVQLGADIDLVGLAPETREAELARLAEAGVSTVRLALDWNRVEPEPGSFIWEADDAAVDAALSHSLQVVLLLGPCAEWAVDPAWEVPPDQLRNSVPRSLDLWQRYSHQAIGHFRQRVSHWQVREQPNARRFRGTHRDYLALLQETAQVLRDLDPAGLLVMPESGSFDAAAIDRLSSSSAWPACDVIGLYPPASAADEWRAALSWAVLRHEILAADGDRTRPFWLLAGDAELATERWIQYYLLSAAFGADRCYLPAAAIGRAWTAPLAELSYLGFLRLGPEVWALVMEGAEGVVVTAWSAEEREISASEFGAVSDAEAVLRAAPVGGAPGSAARAEEGGIILKLGPTPAVIAGLDVGNSLVSGTPTRSDVLAGLPTPDLSAVPSVYADYGMAERPEFGLSNRTMRGLPGGDIGEEPWSGRPCLRTRMSRGSGPGKPDNPWIYFDVDDRWLYLGRGRTPVMITVECAGSIRGEEKLGFNIMYDSSTGYRFSPWQWVGAGYGWRSYRVVLDDASFGNRAGYDFRINAKGSKQDLWVTAVTVEKLPPQE